MEEGQATEIMRRRRFQLTLAEFGIEVNEQQSADIQAAYIGCQFDIQMFDGARELLGRLNEAGFVVGLITNGAEAHQMNKIKAMELDALISPERQFVSGKVGHDKPDRRIFEYVNEQTGTIPASCIYIGDSWRNDVIGAIEAGWRVIWFNHRQAKPESEHKPHDTAFNYEDLTRLLMKNVTTSV